MLGATSDLFRHGQYGLLPQLGHLVPLRADSTEAKLLVERDLAGADDEGDHDDDLASQEHNIMKKWLEEYIELPHEGVGLCVAHAFIVNSAEQEDWTSRQPWKDENQTHNGE